MTNSITKNNDTFKDYQCFIIWKNAREFEDEILNEINIDFEIIKKFYITWSYDKFGENLSAFYGDNFIYDYMQQKIRGNGEFIFIIAKTKRPLYEIRQTSRGPVRVCIQSYDLKYKIRSKYLNSCAFHASNNFEEFRHAIMLLLGYPWKDFFDKTTSTEKIIYLKRDISCVAGWKNLKELFETLNECCNYVVLRGFDALPDKHNYTEHGDIDLLVDDLKKFLAILNPKIPTNENAFRFFNWEDIPGAGHILIHPKFVGDNYYDINMQKELLRSKRLNSNNIYVPSDEMYFWSLLYHGVFHKENWKKYDMIFEKLSKKLKINYKSDKEYLCNILTEYLKSNKYSVSLHLDKLAAHLNKENITDKSLLETTEKFYCYRNETKSFFFHEKAISIAPELVTKNIADYDIFVDLERHVLNPDSSIYNFLLEKYKNNKEFLWRCRNTFDSISILSTKENHGELEFNRYFIDGASIKTDGVFQYTIENNIHYIKYEQFDCTLLKAYKDDDNKRFLYLLDLFVSDVFDKFEIINNDNYLSPKVWDVLPKNAFWTEKSFIYFDKEVEYYKPIKKSIWLAILCLSLDIHFWFSQDEKKEFYEYFIKKYHLADSWNYAVFNRAKEIESIVNIIPNNLEFIEKYITDRDYQLTIKQKKKKNFSKQWFRLLSHILIGKIQKKYRKKYIKYKNL